MNKQLFFFIIIALSIASCSRPTAKFTYELEKKDAPAPINFENTSTNAETYLWDFGDGNTSTEAKPTHEYQSEGNYVIQLQVTKGKKTNVETKEVVIIPPIKTYVVLETTFGDMRILLYNSTPKHKENFIKLVKESFYDDLLFHRVIQSFMIQGGDPSSKNAVAGQALGMGGPGYLVDAEIGAPHFKGTLAAARTGGASNPEKRSSGSQFYIVQGKPVSEAMLTQIERRNKLKYTDEQKAKYAEVGGTPFLDGDYTVFGEVVEGLEVIDKIAAVPKGPGDRPKTNVKMKIRLDLETDKQ